MHWIFLSFHEVKTNEKLKLKREVMKIGTKIQLELTFKIKICMYFQSGFIWIFTPKLQICWNINQLVTNNHHHPYCVGVRSKSFDSSICSLEIQLPTYKRSAGCISWMMPLTIEQLPLAFKLIRFVLKIPVKSPKLKVVKVNKHDWIDTDRLMSRYNQKLENPFKISNPWKWKKKSPDTFDKYANKNVTKKSLA